MYLLWYHTQTLACRHNCPHLVLQNLRGKYTTFFKIFFLQYLFLIKPSMAAIGIISLSLVQTTTFLLHRCIIIHQWYHIIKFDNSPRCDLVVSCTPTIKYKDKLGKTSVHPKCHIKARLYDSYIWIKFMQSEDRSKVNYQQPLQQSWTSWWPLWSFPVHFVFGASVDRREREQICL